jgi:nicotinate-nucleotide adenylyltransferase
MKRDELFSLAKAGGKGLSRFEQDKPALAHGKAAEALLMTRYGVTNGEILEAVRLHTIGSPHMGPLAKVVYIADKIEVSREGVEPGIRDLIPGAGLDELLAAVLENTTEYLRSRQMEISPATLRLLSAVRKKKL